MPSIKEKSIQPISKTSFWVSIIPIIIGLITSLVLGSIGYGQMTQKVSNIETVFKEYKLVNDNRDKAQWEKIAEANSTNTDVRIQQSAIKNQVENIDNEVEDLNVNQKEFRAETNKKLDKQNELLLDIIRKLGNNSNN